MITANTKPNGEYHTFTSLGEEIGETEYGNNDSTEANYIASQFKQGLRGNFPLYVKLENPLVVDAKGSGWDNIPFNSNNYVEHSQIGDIKHSKGRIDTNGLANFAYENGYDGVIIENINDSSTRSGGIGYTTTDYIAFYPSQVKSADTITYDDNGNVIPPSQRFDDASNDIRFREDEEIEPTSDVARTVYDSITRTHTNSRTTCTAFHATRQSISSATYSSRYCKPSTPLRRKAERQPTTFIDT